MVGTIGRGDQKCTAQVMASVVALMLLCSSIAAAATPDHYSLVTIRVMPSRTDTTVDEVWHNGSGGWRLERRSDNWDNGMVALFDGKQLYLHIPTVEASLEAPLTELYRFVDPSFLMPLPQPAQLRVVSRDSVLGKPAILYSGRTFGYNVNRWVDAQTELPVREVHYDNQGRPFLMLMRNELPPAEFDRQRFQPAPAPITREVDAWRKQAVDAWLAEQLHASVHLNTILPKALQVAGAELIRQAEGTVIVLRLMRGDTLISLFIAPAVGSPPTSRRTLNQGMPVVGKRVGTLDITLVGELPTREAVKLLTTLSKQLPTNN